jgi:selenide,water dikinase
MLNLIQNVMPKDNTSTNIKLTSLATCAGCAAKLNPEKLSKLLAPLQDMFPSGEHPELILGLGKQDDAAVWALDDKKALVLTTDFFTPVVDDPHDFGAIAAANALSDIYAMGAKPFLALNILGFPNDLPIEIGSEILLGGAEKAKEAGVVVAGGHTIQDPELKYGMIALGMLDIEKSIRKDGAQAGDAFYLTKPLGFGVTNTATKRELTSAGEDQEVVKWMAMLNRKASELALECGIRAGTDITGFGLIGHAWEMAKAAKLQLQFNFEALPFISGANKFAERFVFPQGSLDNHSYYKEHIEIDAPLSKGEEMLLYDAQTSGGLLLAIAPEKVNEFTQRSKDADLEIWKIGEVLVGDPKITIS